MQPSSRILPHIPVGGRSSAHSRRGLAPTPPGEQQQHHHQQQQQQQHQTTSLPPISSLAYLPHPAPPPYLPPGSTAADYSHLHDSPPYASGPNLHGVTEIYGGVDSEGEEYDQHGPPKKKRRRQALSCTECKRRKIKCDRSQPCAPCTRRGDQAKCQWHIVEPIEKYVTRAEYEELKARFDQLAAYVQRMLPAHLPYYQMGVQHQPPSQQHDNSPGEGAVQYTVGHTYPGPAPTMMAPQQTFHQQHEARYAGKQEEGGQGLDQPQHSPRHSISSGSASGIVAPAGGGGGGGSSSGGLISNSPGLPPRKRSAGGLEKPTHSPATTTRTFSIGNITSPHNASSNAPPSSSSSSEQQQSKNFHAQTLMLGERLRPSTISPRTMHPHTPATSIPKHPGISADHRTLPPLPLRPPSSEMIQVHFRCLLPPIYLPSLDLLRRPRRRTTPCTSIHSRPRRTIPRRRLLISQHTRTRGGSVNLHLWARHLASSATSQAQATIETGPHLRHIQGENADLFDTL